MNRSCHINRYEFVCSSPLAPSLGPYLVSAYSASSTRLMVNWSHLHEEHFLGQPLGYIIAYYPLDLHDKIKFGNVNFTSNTTTLTSLTVYTMYVINVSAVSSGGIGPASTAMARTGAEGNIYFFYDTLTAKKL